ncbi:MAG: hypothetical protein HZB46_13780, partial [Solirubrobacterales bacterium]|nr:hypothetical protein [Solirubrobacterales bacterium]
ADDLTDAYRLCHGEGDRLPGLVLDRYAELAVLRLLPSALNQRQIGEELFLSVNTVKTHCRNIYAKLSAGSREQAVGRARELGLL